MIKRRGDDIVIIISVYFNWGFELSGSNQKYTGKTYLHITTHLGGSIRVSKK